MKKIQQNNDYIFLIVFLLHSILSSLFVITFYVPDEYWQSLEVAHRMVFGYGHLTWEWKEGIRSCIYPTAIAIIYKILHFINCDNVTTVVIVPRLLQAVLTGIGNYYIYKLSILQHGHRTARWTAFCLLTSWFLFYCASRTLSNTAEAAIVSCGLYFFPWLKSSSTDWKYLWLAGLSCMIRPTAILLWMPLYILHCLHDVKVVLYLMLRTLFVLVVCVATMMLLDRLCLGRWVFTPYRFLHFNWFHDIGSFYGSNSWHWYFTQGFPAVMAFHLLPFILAFKSPNVYHFVVLITWMLFILSMPSHKEFRFILPVLPLALCVSGVGLDALAQNGRKHRYFQLSYRGIIMALVIIFGNLFVSGYTAFYHQRGTLDVMNYISKEARQNQKMKVLFLMPCHSTPFYSHVHYNITMQFLTCEPDFNNRPDYIDEADLFYRSPVYWLVEKFGAGIDNGNTELTLPSHIVIFDILFGHIAEFIHYHNYEQCFKTYHTSFPHGKIGSSVEIYCH